MNEPDTPDTGQALIGEVVDEDGYQGPPVAFSDREWPQAWMGPFLDAMALMPVVSAAARTARVNRQYVYEAAKRWPVFAEGWREAYEQGVEIVEQHVHRWATVGIQVKETEIRRVVAPNGEVTETSIESTRQAMSPSLAMYVLSRHRPEYRQKASIEHTLPRVPAAAGVDPDEVERIPTRERMLELARIAQRLEPTTEEG